MSAETEFTSPAGTLMVDSGKVFNFVTDIRNFSRFIPADSISDWVADIDSCSFRVNPMGEVAVTLTEKTPATLVKFEGTAMQSIGFKVWIQLKETEPGHTKFRIVVRAILNPFYKLIATKPASDFLERLVSEIENFEGWDDVISDTQSL